MQSLSRRRYLAGCLVGSLLPMTQLAAETTADELARLQPVMDTSYRGMHSDFFADPLGRFMDLLGGGAIAEARALRTEACSVWARDRSASPLTGRFEVQHVMLDLNRICGLATLH